MLSIRVKRFWCLIKDTMQAVLFLVFAVTIVLAANLEVASSGYGVNYSTTGKADTSSSATSVTQSSSGNNGASSGHSYESSATSSGSAPRNRAAPSPTVPKYSTASLAAEEATEANAHSSITSGSGKSSGRY